MEQVADRELAAIERDIEEEESAASALIRYLAQHARYEAALLFTQGQYLLYHRKGAQVLCKGLSKETLRAAFVGEPVDSGWLPEGVVRWGCGQAGTFIVKYIPQGRQQIRLSTNHTAQPLIMTLPLPALIFAGVGTTYYVWALQGKRCDPTAQLSHAPFPNVYPEGNICFGGNRPPVAGWKTLEEAWQLFLTAPFRADMASGRSRQFPEDVRRQLIALAEKNARRYPVNDLIPYVGGQRYFGRSKEVRTLDEAIDYYLLKKKGDNE